MMTPFSQKAGLPGDAAVQSYGFGFSRPSQFERLAPALDEDPAEVAKPLVGPNTQTARMAA